VDPVPHCTIFTLLSHNWRLRREYARSTFQGGRQVSPPARVHNLLFPGPPGPSSKKSPSRVIPSIRGPHQIHGRSHAPGPLRVSAPTTFQGGLQVLSLSLSLSIYIYIHIYVYTYIHTFMNIYTYMFVFRYRYRCIYMHRYISLSPPPPPPSLPRFLSLVLSASNVAGSCPIHTVEYGPFIKSRLAPR
jgi:hypothetical protein